MTTKTTTTRSGASPHQWHFFRAGGFDQVHLRNGADLLALDALDQKLWVALACPTKGLHFDSRTLALIDTDQDGRVRAPELLAAVRWVGRTLKNPDDLLKAEAAVPLSRIDDTSPQGQTLLNSARSILANLGKPDAAAITLDDATDTAKIFAQTVFNGDGIIVEDSASDDATKSAIRDIIACLGAATDRSGKPGIDQAKVDQFFAAAQAFSDWWKQTEADQMILPLGEATASVAATIQAVKAKVNDFFTRCRLAAFDSRATEALNREEKEYLDLAARDLTVTCPEVAGFPLAGVEAGKALPLKEGVNPAWADAIAKLRREAVQPLLGEKRSLTEAEWQTLLAKIAPFDAWQAAKAGASVEKLGLKRVREILGSQTKEMLLELIAKDKAEEANANAITAVEKLVRFHRDLYRLCTNFVNFRDFYRRGQSIFQAGTLYLDQRSCELCLPVEDAGRHAAMAGLAGTYLAYCDCVRKSSGEKLQIVAAFTDGDADHLMVGRNGIFYDRHGRDWDATITRIVDNPISLRQAFWAPYKKFVRMIEEQVAKRAAAAEAASATWLEGAAVATADKAKAAAPKKIDTGTVAALGVGLGAIATVFGGFVSGFIRLKVWQMALAVVGVMLVISGPSMLIAWLKLRKRNLGPILDANGWAVNAKAKLNVPFGKSLTQVAALPPGSSRDLRDPFREKKSIWPKVIILAVMVWIAYAVLDRMGKIHQWTQGRVGKPAPQQLEKVEGAKNSPEPAAPAEPAK